MPNFTPKNRKSCRAPSLFILCVIVSLSACLGPRSHSTDESARTDGPEKTIVIPLFHNATLEPLIEKELTRIFKETFYARGWHVENKHGHSQKKLSGQIAGFSVTPTALTRTGGAREYQIHIRMEIEVLQGSAREKIFETRVEGIADYIARSDSAASRAAKNRAIREAGREMAERVSVFLEMLVGNKE